MIYYSDDFNNPESPVYAIDYGGNDDVYTSHDMIFCFADKPSVSDNVGDVVYCNRLQFPRQMTITSGIEIRGFSRLCSQEMLRCPEEIACAHFILQMPTAASPKLLRTGAAATAGACQTPQEPMTITLNGSRSMSRAVINFTVSKHIKIVGNTGDRRNVHIAVRASNIGTLEVLANAGVQGLFIESSTISRLIVRTPFCRVFDICEGSVVGRLDIPKMLTESFVFCGQRVMLFGRYGNPKVFPGGDSLAWSPDGRYTALQSNSEKMV